MNENVFLIDSDRLYHLINKKKIIYVMFCVKIKITLYSYYNSNC